MTSPFAKGPFSSAQRGHCPCGRCSPTTHIPALGLDGALNRLHTLNPLPLQPQPEPRSPGPSGQAQFEVGFFKLLCLSPVAVRTKVRAAPMTARHVAAAAAAAADAETSSGGSSGGSSSGGGCSGRCFLEVSIENAMRDDNLLLRSVRFIPLPGVSAEDPVAAISQAQSSTSSRTSTSGSGSGVGELCDSTVPGGHLANGSASSSELEGRDGGGGSVGNSHPENQKQRGATFPIDIHTDSSRKRDQSDTDPHLDTSSLKQALAHPPSANHGSSHTPKGRGPCAPQDDASSLHGAGPPVTPRTAPPPPLALGGNRHFLWTVLRQDPAGAVPGGADHQQQQQQKQQPKGGLGWLEIRWASTDGRSGRLQTQPIVGAVPFSSAAQNGVSLGLERLPAVARIDQALTVVLRVEAGPTAPAPGARRKGPLLLLHSDAPHHPPHKQREQQSLARASPPVVNQKPSGFVQQPASGARRSPSPQRGASASAPVAAASAGAAATSSPSSEWGAAGPPVLGVVVLGPKVVQLGELQPAEVRLVEVSLLPLRRGWQRLPAFVVVDSEGAPCSSVHDVSMLIS